MKKNCSASLAKLVVVLSILLLTAFPVRAQQNMYVHFIEMGQGLATLLQFPKGVVMIDAGAQVGKGNKASQERVLAYLDKFFSAHPEYNNTIQALLVTHNHQDHTGTVPAIHSKYTIKNIVTTRYNLGGDINVVTKSTPGLGKLYVEYTSVLKELPNGLTSVVIDPLKDFQGVNPAITIYSGRNKSYKTGTANFHSLAIKVKFGKATFMFTGDLEEKAINYMLKQYKDHADVFDVDVYQVGHHGSPNANTDKLLDVLLPDFAIISAGPKDESGLGTAFDHGHPRTETIELLSRYIHKSRTPAITGHSFDSPDKKSKPLQITKDIYCTCWDGNIVVKATSDGKYTVVTRQ